MRINTGGSDLFVDQLTAVMRGGLVLLAGSSLWCLFVRGPNDPFLTLGLAWLPCAWLVFPAGAILGAILPNLVRSQPWGSTLVASVGLGAAAGLVLAAGFWIVNSHNDLLGLYLNRKSAGFLSYSLSVHAVLRDRARQALAGPGLVTSAWIVFWAVWLKFRSRSSNNGPHLPNPSGVMLCLDYRLLYLTGWVAIGLMIFETVMLLLTSLLIRGVHVPVSSYFVVGLGSMGLVFLGPFLAPILTNGGFDFAWKYAVVGVPVLSFSLLPFVLCRRPVRAGLAVVAWCGFITAVLLWVSLGLLSLGRRLG